MRLARLTVTTASQSGLRAARSGHLLPCPRPMSLVNILDNGLTVPQMKAFAGKTRCKGATCKDELVFAVLLALAERKEAGIQALPVAVRKKLESSPVAQRELKRMQLASSGDKCKRWSDLKQVLVRFPPSILMQILHEEMTAAQMQRMAGKTRCDGASVKVRLNAASDPRLSSVLKRSRHVVNPCARLSLRPMQDELVFACLLALAEHGPKAMRDLPAAAQTRIEAAPMALEWVKMIERADTEVLAKVGTWRGFTDLLCTPVGAPSSGDDDEEDEEDEEEADVDAEEEAEAGSAVEAPDDAAVQAAAAKVALLEAQLAEAKAALQGTATKAPRTRASAAAATAPAKKKLDFETTAPKKAGSKGATETLVRATHKPTPYSLLLLEALVSFLLPVGMILTVIWLAGPKGLPGRPGDDLKLHALAK